MIVIIGIIDIIASCPVFSGAKRETVGMIASGSQLQSFRSGELIYGTSDVRRRMAVIVSGRASVYSADEGQRVLLRTLSAGDTVGVANLFSDSRFVSRIYADGACRVLFVPEELIAKAIETDRDAAYSYIGFLSGRIRYLNSMICCLTAGTAERRLAVWLDSRADADGNVTLPGGVKPLSEMLNVGRASLYRAFDKLTADGFIQKDGKKIIILDREKMVGYYS